MSKEKIVREATSVLAKSAPNLKQDRGVVPGKAKCGPCKEKRDRDGDITAVPAKSTPNSCMYSWATTE